MNAYCSELKAKKRIIISEVLTLPCINTLNRYIKAIKGYYDFQENIFKLLKEKSVKMESFVVRGKSA